MSKLRTEMEMELRALKAVRNAPAPYSCGAMAPSSQPGPSGSVWCRPTLEKRHLSCCPIPTSCFLHYPDTRVEKGEQGGEKGLSAGYQRWLFLASSSFLKTFNILCSVLHEIKLGLGQEWAESLESSVGRNLVTPSRPPTPSPLPELSFPLS